ncbi:hypothetical protein BH24CHL6_BH24CHL6_16450 [soil metagenome]
MSLPVRRRMPARRTRRRVRRRRVVNWWRLLGGALMVVTGGGMAWLLAAADFEVDPAGVELSGLHYTDARLVHSTMRPWLNDGVNLFRLPAADIELALTRLPAVASADVQVLLPNRLKVAVLERVPVFVWRTGQNDYLVDSAGVLLRTVLPTEALSADLPLVDDGRQAQAQPQPGDVLEAVDLQAILKLGAVDPALLGSRAEWLSLSVEEHDGYVLSAEPGAWRAVFGHYTPTLRPPDIIDRQVQCLRALLDTDEGEIETIYLSVSDERCGTYIARARPAPSDEPEPGEEPDDG